MRIFSALVLARAASVSSSASSRSSVQPRMLAIWRWPLGVEVLAGVLDLLCGVEHGAVVDPDRVGVLVLDDGAVHERAEVLERLVVQVGAGDPLRDGLGELRGDLVHVGEAVGHRHRDLLAGRALGDAGADRVGERELAAEVVRALGRDAEVGADGGDPVGLAAARRGPPSSRAAAPAGRRATGSRAGWPGPGCGGSRPRSARGRAAARSGSGPARRSSYPAVPASCALAWAASSRRWPS